MMNPAPVVPAEMSETGPPHRRGRANVGPGMMMTKKPTARTTDTRRAVVDVIGRRGDKTIATTTPTAGGIGGPLDVQEAARQIATLAESGRGGMKAPGALPLPNVNDIATSGRTDGRIQRRGMNETDAVLKLRPDANTSLIKSRLWKTLS